MFDYYLFNGQERSTSEDDAILPLCIGGGGGELKR